MPGVHVQTEGGREFRVESERDVSQLLQRLLGLVRHLKSQRVRAFLELQRVLEREAFKTKDTFRERQARISICRLRTHNYFVTGHRFSNHSQSPRDYRTSFSHYRSRNLGFQHDTPLMSDLEFDAENRQSFSILTQVPTDFDQCRVVL